MPGSSAVLAILAVLAVSLATPAARRRLTRGAAGARAHALPHQPPDLPARLHDSLVSILILAALSDFPDPGLDSFHDLRVHLGQVDPVFILDQGPIYALEHAFLDQWPVRGVLQRREQVREVCLREEDVSTLQLALGEQLQDLDEALACLLDQGDVELGVEQVDAGLEVVEDLVDVVDDGVLARDHEVVQM